MKEPSFFFAISISQLYIVLCTRPQYMYQIGISSLCQLSKPVETSLLGIWAEQYAQLLVLTDQPERKQMYHLKEKLRAYCPNIYIL